MITFEALASGSADIQFEPFLVDLEGVSEPVQVQRFSCFEWEVFASFDREDDDYVYKQNYRAMTGDLRPEGPDDLNTDVLAEKIAVLKKRFTVRQMLDLFKKVYVLNGVGEQSIGDAEKK